MHAHPEWLISCTCTDLDSFSDLFRGLLTLGVPVWGPSSREHWSFSCVWLSLSPWQKTVLKWQRGSLSKLSVYRLFRGPTGLYSTSKFEGGNCFLYAFYADSVAEWGAKGRWSGGKGCLMYLVFPFSLVWVRMGLGLETTCLLRDKEPTQPVLGLSKSFPYFWCSEHFCLFLKLVCQMVTGQTHCYICPPWRGDRVSSAAGQWVQVG